MVVVVVPVDADEKLVLFQHDFFPSSKIAIISERIVDYPLTYNFKLVNVRTIWFAADFFETFKLSD